MKIDNYIIINLLALQLNEEVLELMAKELPREKWDARYPETYPNFKILDKLVMGKSEVGIYSLLNRGGIVGLDEKSNPFYRVILFMHLFGIPYSKLKLTTSKNLFGNRCSYRLNMRFSISDLEDGINYAMNLDWRNASVIDKTPRSSVNRIRASLATLEIKDTEALEFYKDETNYIHPSMYLGTLLQIT